MIQGNRGQLLRCDGKTVERDQPFDLQLAASTFPDVRLVGHEPFFLPHIPGLFASLKTTYSPAREFKLQALAGDNPSDFRIELPIVRGVNKTLFQKVWHISSQRMVPTEFSNRVFNPEKEKWIVLSTEHFEWTDINGFELPASLIGNRKRVGKTDDGTPIYFQVDYEANFYWLSVNEAMDEKRFDFSSVDNPTLVSKTIAVAKAKAGF